MNNGDLTWEFGEIHGINHGFSLGFTGFRGVLWEQHGDLTVTNVGIMVYKAKFDLCFLSSHQWQLIYPRSPNGGFVAGKIVKQNEGFVRQQTWLGSSHEK